MEENSLQVRTAKLEKVVKKVLERLSKVKNRLICRNGRRLTRRYRMLSRTTSLS
jgi:rRNA processing protein Krr1/Pno1